MSVNLSRHMNFDESKPSWNASKVAMHENFKERGSIRFGGINHALTLGIPACSANGSTGSVEKRKLRASDAKRLEWPLIPGGHTGDGLSGIPPGGHPILSLHSRLEFDSPIPDGVSSATRVHHSDRPMLLLWRR